MQNDPTPDRPADEQRPNPQADKTFAILLALGGVILLLKLIAIAL